MYLSSQFSPKEFFYISTYTIQHTVGTTILLLALGYTIVFIIHFVLKCISWTTAERNINIKQYATKPLLFITVVIVNYVFWELFRHFFKIKKWKESKYKLFAEEVTSIIQYSSIDKLKSLEEIIQYYPSRKINILSLKIEFLGRFIAFILHILFIEYFLRAVLYKEFRLNIYYLIFISIRIAYIIFIICYINNVWQKRNYTPAATNDINFFDKARQEVSYFLPWKAISSITYFFTFVVSLILIVLSCKEKIANNLVSCCPEIFATQVSYASIGHYKAANAIGEMASKNFMKIIGSYYLQQPTWTAKTIKWMDNFFTNPSLLLLLQNKESTFLPLDLKGNLAPLFSSIYFFLLDEIICNLHDESIQKKFDDLMKTVSDMSSIESERMPVKIDFPHGISFYRYENGFYKNFYDKFKASEPWEREKLIEEEKIIFQHSFRSYVIRRIAPDEIRKRIFLMEDDYIIRKIHKDVFAVTKHSTDNKTYENFIYQLNFYNSHIDDTKKSTEMNTSLEKAKREIILFAILNAIPILRDHISDKEEKINIMVSLATMICNIDNIVNSNSFKLSKEDKERALYSIINIDQSYDIAYAHRIIYSLKSYLNISLEDCLLILEYFKRKQIEEDEKIQHVFLQVCESYSQFKNLNLEEKNNFLHSLERETIKIKNLKYALITYESKKNILFSLDKEIENEFINAVNSIKDSSKIDQKYKDEIYREIKKTIDIKTIELAPVLKLTDFNFATVKFLTLLAIRNRINDEDSSYAWVQEIENEFNTSKHENQLNFLLLLISNFHLLTREQQNFVENSIEKVKEAQGVKNIIELYCSLRIALYTSKKYFPLDARLIEYIEKLIIIIGNIRRKPVTSSLDSSCFDETFLKYYLENRNRLQRKKEVVVRNPNLHLEDIDKKGDVKDSVSMVKALKNLNFQEKFEMLTEEKYVNKNQLTVFSTTDLPKYLPHSLTFEVLQTELPQEVNRILVGSHSKPFILSLVLLAGLLGGMFDNIGVKELFSNLICTVLTGYACLNKEDDLLLISSDESLITKVAE